MGTRIAIVGCGAVANAHLPIIAEASGSTATVLVDKALERAQSMASEHGVAHAVADYNEIVEHADAAIIALPHHLHARVSIDLLEKGIHVLVEKPMGMTTGECDQMVAAATGTGATLAVGLVSRYLGVARHVKELIDRGVLGEIKRFDVREGTIYDWPVASDFMFRTEMGGGVLADTGAHVLDLLMWWLGDYASVEYRDDAVGGAEADCELQLRMASGAEGVVQMSRTRALRNTWILEGERATLEVSRRFDASFRWTINGYEVGLEGGFKNAGEPEDPLDAFRLQWADFLDAIATKRAPLLGGTEGRRGVALIEACRAAAAPMDRSWEAFV
jgi:predicted dehydrogenase